MDATVFRRLSYSGAYELAVQRKPSLGEYYDVSYGFAPGDGIWEWRYSSQLWVVVCLCPALILGVHREVSIRRYATGTSKTIAV